MANHFQAKLLLGATLLLVICLSQTVDGSNSTCPTGKTCRVKRATNDAVAHLAREALEAFKNLLKHGFPEIGIPSFEPAKLDNFVYDGKHHGVKVHSNFTDMYLYGLSNLEIKSIAVDMAKLTLGIALKFHTLNITGHYNLTGKLLAFINIHGNDKFDLNATDVLVTGQSAMKTHANGSLSVDNLLLSMEVDKVKFHFYKINGGGAASSILNGLTNFFGKSIFDQAKPKLLQRMTTAISTTLNRKLATVNVFKI